MYAFKRGFNQEQEKMGRRKRMVNQYKQQTEQKGAGLKQLCSRSKWKCKGKEQYKTEE